MVKAALAGFERDGYLGQMLVTTSKGLGAKDGAANGGPGA